jgi:hypothetical protein
MRLKKHKKVKPSQTLAASAWFSCHDQLTSANPDFLSQEDNHRASVSAQADFGTIMNSSTNGDSC